MALDEPSDKDQIQVEAGFRMIIEKNLLRQSGGVTVDYLNGPMRKGFNVKATSQGGCSTEGSGCSGCG